MNAREHYVRARQKLAVTVLLPGERGTQEPMTGTLLGEMHDRGQLLHYRVSLGNGTVLLAPPAWIHPSYAALVVEAGLTPLGAATEKTTDRDIAATIHALYAVLSRRHRKNGRVPPPLEPRTAANG